MSGLSGPRKLAKGDLRDEFDSGARELDDWLKRYALQNQKANNAVVYAVLEGAKVVAYYALCAAGVSRAQVPDEFGSGRPRDIPCVLLARFAVDKSVQGCGVGKALLRDAVLRAEQAAGAIGAACLLVHCRDEQAKSFYLRQAEFRESPVDPMHLVLRMEDIRRLMGR